MTLPFSGPISLFQVNCELYRAGGSCLCMNEGSVRRLIDVDAGGACQNLDSNTSVSLSKLYGHAFYYRGIGDCVQNVDIVTDAANNGRYSAGRTWISYYINGNGRIGSTSTGAYALTTRGSYPDYVQIYNDAGGYIVGAGGNGGAGEGGNGNPGRTGGTPGGPAMIAQVRTYLWNYGVIGGGGGGGSGSNNQGGDAGGGGGGGAGYNSLLLSIPRGGVGGNGPGGSNNGVRGCLELGGNGGGNEYGSQRGGDGGDLGFRGCTGTNGAPIVGGNAGASIVSFANVSLIACNPNSIRGSTA